MPNSIRYIDCAVNDISREYYRNERSAHRRNGDEDKMKMKPWEWYMYKQQCYCDSRTSQYLTHKPNTTHATSNKTNFLNIKTEFKFGLSSHPIDS